MKSCKVEKYQVKGCLLGKTTFMRRFVKISDFGLALQSCKLDGFFFAYRMRAVDDPIATLQKATV
jgi:hypothetical protein